MEKCGGDWRRSRGKISSTTTSADATRTTGNPINTINPPFQDSHRNSKIIETHRNKEKLNLFCQIHPPPLTPHLSTASCHFDQQTGVMST
mmetsp:Transcript_13601/g.15059  ORF Transcript_13601/g.15059 Transcript_13601/m.15059 type:complete len:90 (+) Transcript_13601:83-352(+)